MKLIAGLGNPGESYVKSRHNAGGFFVEKIAQDLNISFEDLKEEKIAKSPDGDFLLLRPQEFMNESGVAVKKIADFYKIRAKDIVVIHDDLDIVLGEYKIQFGREPKQHYGIKSINERLGTNKYWRVRIGIENRPEEPSIREKGESYVLNDFTIHERKILESMFDGLKNKLFELISK